MVPIVCRKRDATPVARVLLGGMLGTRVGLLGLFCVHSLPGTLVAAEMSERALRRP